jgi:hypothetical protein
VSTSQPREWLTGNGGAGLLGAGTHGPGRCLWLPAWAVTADGPDRASASSWWHFSWGHELAEGRYRQVRGDEQHVVEIFGPVLSSVPSRRGMVASLCCGCAANLVRRTGCSSSTRMAAVARGARQFGRYAVVRSLACALVSLRPRLSRSKPQ